MAPALKDVSQMSLYIIQVIC